MTAAGDLKWRVRFDKQTDTPNPYGGTVAEGWAEQFTRSAEIIALSGGEGVQAERLTGTQPYRLRVRYDSLTKTIEPSWRAVELLNGVPQRYLAIKTVEDMDRSRQWLTLLAVSGVADGGDGA